MADFPIQASLSIKNASQDIYTKINVSVFQQKIKHQCNTE